MEFNSWTFLAFFLSVWIMHRLAIKAFYRNTLLLGASYVFYAAWDWRFLGLIILSTIVDFIAGKYIYNSNKLLTQRVALFISITVNLSVLAFFKYYNFFTSELISLLADSGINANQYYLGIILPVGISFYTFQTLSYSIDIYRGRLEPEKHLLNFAVFVAFFPQLVAGPIERARNLLPQLEIAKTASKNQILEGVSLIAVGLFKKIYIADNLARIVDPLYANSAHLTASHVYIASIAFAFQILADFSAYTDIARGVAKCLGLELMENLKNPYISLNPQEFWRRWHISLSSWLRDYLYIGLGGSRKSTFFTYRNLMLTMMIGGFWHGAAWNYIWWGIYHGVLLCVHRFVSGFGWWRIPKTIAWFTMFHLTLIGWLIFRSTRVVIIDGIPQDRSGAQLVELLSAYQNGWYSANVVNIAGEVAFFAIPLILIEIYRGTDQQLAEAVSRPYAGPALAGVIMFLVALWGVQNASSFIYFQF